MLFAVLGILSAVIFLLGDVPYLKDTLGGSTRPHKVTWGIATLLNAIGFANQYASGATNSLWLFGAGTLMVGAIFLASFKHGTDGLSRQDILCMAVALGGVGLWIILKSPLYSIFANIIAASAALIPSYIKAGRDPESETKISWLVGTASCLLSAVSVGRWDWRLLILPGAETLLQTYMVYLLYIRPRKVSN
jgi:hypothetical protein